MSSAASTGEDSRVTSASSVTSAASVGTALRGPTSGSPWGEIAPLVAGVTSRAGAIESGSGASGSGASGSGSGGRFSVEVGSADFKGWGAASSAGLGSGLDSLGSSLDSLGNVDSGLYIVPAPCFGPQLSNNSSGIDSTSISKGSSTSSGAFNGGSSAAVSWEDGSWPGLFWVFSTKGLSSPASGDSAGTVGRASNTTDGCMGVAKSCEAAWILFRIAVASSPLTRCGCPASILTGIRSTFIWRSLKDTCSTADSVVVSAVEAPNTKSPSEYAIGRPL